MVPRVITTGHHNIVREPYKSGYNVTPTNSDARPNRYQIAKNVFHGVTVLSGQGIWILELVMGLVNELVKPLAVKRPMGIEKGYFGAHGAVNNFLDDRVNWGELMDVLKMGSKNFVRKIGKQNAESLISEDNGNYLKIMKYL